jgi:hypothetical protein
MIERKYEVTVRDKSLNFIGLFFNGWNINGLEDYIGTCVGNIKNNFYINFINSRFDPYRNISFYGSKRRGPKYFIVETKQLLLKNF